jgi:hypothetical protein
MHPVDSLRFLGLDSVMGGTGLRLFVVDQSSIRRGPRWESRPRMGHPWQINAPNLCSQILIQPSLNEFLQRSAAADGVEGGEESLARGRCGDQPYGNDVEACGGSRCYEMVEWGLFDACRGLNRVLMEEEMMP